MATERRKQVCVVGGGAAGLIALRHLLASQNFDAILFEQSDCVGGVWVQDLINPSSHEARKPQQRNSMYRDLRTNLPKEIMGFLDFPFQGSGSGRPSFIHHSEVLSYLQSLADKFQLNQYIQFNKQVIHIKPMGSKWKVVVHSTTQACSNEEHVFDIVFICNGHYSKPIIPSIPDIDLFKGTVFHSKEYRHPEAFKGKKVLLVGAGPSGIDISLEIAGQAGTQVIMSMRNPPLESKLPSNVKQTFPIKSVNGENGFIFEDGEVVDNVQTLIYCTGYAYDFPFLGAECGVRVERGKFVSPLHKQMIHSRFPSLCFIGLPFNVLPFILFDCQVRYYMKYLEGGIIMPGIEEDKRLEVKTPNGVHTHKLAELQWEYFYSLAEAAGFQNLLSRKVLENIREICDATAERRQRWITLYRNDVIRIVDKDGRMEHCVREVNLTDE